MLGTKKQKLVLDGRGVSAGTRSRQRAPARVRAAQVHIENSVRRRPQPAFPGKHRTTVKKCLSNHGIRCFSAYWRLRHFGGNLVRLLASIPAVSAFGGGYLRGPVWKVGRMPGMPGMLEAYCRNAGDAGKVGVAFRRHVQSLLN